MIEQRGLIVGPSDILATLPANAFKVTSWQNDRSPKTQDATYAILRAANVRGESKFDAAHGRRYMLFVYRTADERRACWAFLTNEPHA